MAKGAATEDTLGGLHAQLARVFGLTLKKYEKAMELLDASPTDEIDEALIEQLVLIQEPNPAMLSAIAKFLKDNDIGMDSEEVEQLNATERRLQERRAARKAAGVNLSVVPHVGE
ncbi:terminase small subunit [Paracoccus phage ParMal1]|uniref:Terminase small subunit n=1 Tax=Paracoccus phage ParMal1 TaxID=3032416 RepID=A0AAF0FD76_9CAUD|nr:terminase small subunit [Paracoccus phage ParMal1]